VRKHGQRRPSFGQAPRREACSAVGARDKLMVYGHLRDQRSTAAGGRFCTGVGWRLPLPCLRGAGTMESGEL